MRFREVEVTPQAEAEARQIGLGGDAKKRLARMARRSAPITHDKGNWRFEDFVLQITEGKVLGVSRLA
jgi:hypothetical protein